MTAVCATPRAAGTIGGVARGQEAREPARGHDGAAASTVAHTAVIVVTLVFLHPLEYIAMNSLAGASAGAYGRFDLDYGAWRCPETLRRLGMRIAPRPVAAIPARWLHWREQLASRDVRRN